MQQNFPANGYEILIVDNASTDATKDVVEAVFHKNPSHGIRYFYEPQPGLLSGRHRGALEANGQVLTFIDDDIETGPHWLHAIQESFSDPSVQLVGGRNLPKYETPPPDWLEWFWTFHPNGKTCEYLSLLDFGTYTHAIDADYVWGLNFSIRKQALFDLGGFHPDCIPKHLQHFQGDGETGLTRKAKEYGYKTIYNPEACIFHWVPQSRMTYAYFEQRNFYQGVCTSYTEIRENQGLSHISSKNVLTYIKKLVNTLRKAHSQEESLKMRFASSYKQGYQFHQQAVRQCPELLMWVLRKSYWDYSLPELSSTQHTEDE